MYILKKIHTCINVNNFLINKAPKRDILKSFNVLLELDPKDAGWSTHYPLTDLP